MQGLIPRVSPALQLSRISTAFSALTNAIFMVLWTRSIPPEREAADAALTAAGSVWPMLMAAGVYSLGMFAYAASLNDLIDARRDATHHPSRPLPVGAIRSNAAVLFTVLALLSSIAGATWLGPDSTRAAIATAVLILVYNATFKFLPAFSFTTIGLIHAAHMYTVNPSVQSIWPIILIQIHTTAASAAAHVVARRRPRVTPIGWCVIALGVALWVSIILTVTRFSNETLWPDWLSPAAFVGPLLLSGLFVGFTTLKLKNVNRGRTAAEKLSRYAAVWTPLYATAWCFSLASEFPALGDAGLVLAGIGLAGLVGVTMLREVFAVVEHPVGYRR